MNSPQRLELPSRQEAPAPRSSGIARPGEGTREGDLLDRPAARAVVDAARAVGILLVVLFHVFLGVSQLVPEPEIDEFIGRIPSVLNFGWQALGSELVFLMSGFLLAYLLLREARRTGHIDVRDFYVRRGSRIVPMYVLALVLFAPTVHFDAWELALNLAFASKLFRAKTILPVGWSLELLVQMYVLLPFLVLGVRRANRPLVVTGILLAASVLLRLLVLLGDPAAYATPFHTFLHGGAPSVTQEDLYYLLPYRATPFLAGLFLAHLVLEHGPALRRAFARPGVRVGVPLLGLVLVIASSSVPIHDRSAWIYGVTGPGFWLAFWTLQRPVFVAGTSLLLLTAWYGAPWLSRVAQARFWGRVSRGIYTIYLYHLACLIPAAALVFWTVDPDSVHDVTALQALAIWAIGVALSVGLAGVMTRRLELPAQRWIRARMGRPPVRR